jgi:hypothetical protein
MDKKKSIINIQDLNLSVASRHSIDGQLILQDIYREISIFRKKIIYLKKKNSRYWRAINILNEWLEISILSIIS